MLGPGDPIPDVRTCAAEVRSFCVKDHRNWPRDEDCGPGFGEIDHYKLLSLGASAAPQSVAARTGLLRRAFTFPRPRP